MSRRARGATRPPAVGVNMVLASSWGSGGWPTSPANGVTAAISLRGLKRGRRRKHAVATRRARMKSSA
eukprot:scaffold158407_cov24-Tisochrysis_lutea.AAC.2